MFTELHEDVDLAPAWVDIYYDLTLQQITGHFRERSMVNRGCPFIFVLQSVLMSYPEIEKQFPPGVLGFTLNGVSPGMMDALKEGDRVCFVVY